MKFALEKQHRDFFNRNGFVEFENILNEEQLEMLNIAINVALGSRLNVMSERLKTVSSSEQFSAGHDLWRSNEALKKFVLNLSFAEIVRELVQRRMLRLGFDQLFPSILKRDSYQMQNSYAAILNSVHSLNEISSISGLVCGLMLNIQGAEREVKNPDGHLNIYPAKPGNGIFFSPEKQIQFDKIDNFPETRFLMIAYADYKSQFIQSKGDPHHAALKKLGYVIGDKLSDRWHPVFFR